MADQRGAFPRRDDAGRIAHLPDLVGIGLAGAVLGLLALALFDLVVAAFGSARFGGANGWIAAVLPAWMFLDDFRTWEYGAARVVAALAGALAAIPAGLLVASVVSGLPPLFSGGLAAVTFTVVYAVVWFVGVRWLSHRTG
ncbi:hypothetical protein [Plantactinospora sp. GCM10030261]|uniref:hypothetical protein n=1 Tax=Plantactinospora sp. GCM10030261 TaxID=3273420 RepID=UPI003615EBA2